MCNGCRLDYLGKVMYEKFPEFYEIVNSGDRERIKRFVDRLCFDEENKVEKIRFCDVWWEGGRFCDVWWEEGHFRAGLCPRCSMSQNVSSRLNRYYCYHCGQLLRFKKVKMRVIKKRKRCTFVNVPKGAVSGAVSFGQFSEKKEDV